MLTTRLLNPVIGVPGTFPYPCESLYCKIDHEARDKLLEVVIHLCMAPDEGGKMN
jgi:hypothetical protein